MVGHLFLQRDEYADQLIPQNLKFCIITFKRKDVVRYELAVNKLTSFLKRKCVNTILIYRTKIY